HPNIVPYQSFATVNGYIILAVGNDTQFKRFCELANHAELADDLRFTTNRERVRNRAILIPIIEKIMQQRNSEEWLQKLDEENIPCGPINTIDKVFANEQIQHRGMQLKMSHPVAEEISMVANPIQFSKTPNRYDRPPPLLGEHTEEILTELLKMDAVEIETLKNADVIQ
ncbi:MAG: CoA transferase, partial [Gammaproteobacteria bacterium]|nr:CoA transferase [Gammaproteobacteria bacterium]